MTTERLRRSVIALIVLLTWLLPGLLRTADAHGGQYPPPDPRVPFRTPTRGTSVPPGPTTSTSDARLGFDDWMTWWGSQRRSFLRTRMRLTETPEATPSRHVRRVREVLLAGIDDPNEDVATASLVALGRLGQDTVEAPLIAVLADPARTQSVREAAACGLALLGRRNDSDQPRAALEKVAATRGTPHRLRGIAIYALGLRKELDSIEFLIGLTLASSTPTDVVAAAAAALGLSQSVEATPTLTALARGNEDEDAPPELVRIYAIHGLASSGDRSALPLLRALTEDPESAIRRAAMLAATALSVRADSATEKALRRRMERERSVPCRDVAVLCLGRLGHPRSATTLRNAWAGGQSVHRTYAATALGFWTRIQDSTKGVLPVRQALAGDTPWLLRGAATVAIAVARDRDAATFLISAAEAHSDTEVRAISAAVLPEIAPREDAAPVLRRLLVQGIAPLVKREAAMALGALGDVAATPALLRVIEGTDGLYERGAATVALGRIGGPGAVKQLLAIATDPDSEDVLRSLATAALGILLEHPSARPLHDVGRDLDWQSQSEIVTELLSIL